MPDVMCPTSMCLASEAVEGPLLEYFDCQIAKQCSAFFNDDDCAASAGTPDAEQTQFVSRCTAKNTECGGDFSEFCAGGGGRSSARNGSTSSTPASAWLAPTSTRA